MTRPAQIDRASTGGARDSQYTLAQAAQSSDTALVAAVKALSEHGQQPGALLPVLHAIQDEIGYVPPHVVPLIAEHLQRSRAEVHGVITFYPHFRQEPPCRHVVALCRAEACQARGAAALIAHAECRLGVPLGGESGRDVALAPLYCLGLCAQGPAAEIDGQLRAHLTPARLDALLAEAGIPCTVEVSS